jgi:hypothetical protein
MQDLSSATEKIERTSALLPLGPQPVPALVRDRLRRKTSTTGTSPTSAVPAVNTSGLSTATSAYALLV